MANLEYHAFRKPKVLKNGKTVHRWYYYWIDAQSGKQIQKSCGRNIRSRADAEDYIRALPAPPLKNPGTAAAPGFLSGNPHERPQKMRNNPDMLVREIAETMFIPGSDHLSRRRQLKKSVSIETLKDKRVFIRYILEVWGDRTLCSLELDEVMNYLFLVDRSASWKNQYLCTLNEIYQEGQFLGCKIYKPNFPTIGKESNKADIFTEAELERLFRPGNFSPDFFFLFFLASLSGGLRLGEARALRPKQIIFEKKAVIVDGFLKADGRRTVYNKCGSPEHPKLRVVPYPDLTLRLLQQHIEKNDIAHEDAVFTYNGSPVSNPLAECAFNRALLKAGFTPPLATLKANGNWKRGRVVKKDGFIADGRRLIPHSLRYTYITRMSRDVDAHNLLKITGHESTVMIDYYNRKNLEMALASIPDADTATQALLPAAITGAS
jgi:integrase